MTLVTLGFHPVRNGGWCLEDDMEATIPDVQAVPARRRPAEVRPRVGRLVPETDWSADLTEDDRRALEDLEGGPEPEEVA